MRGCVRWQHSVSVLLLFSLSPPKTAHVYRHSTHTHTCGAINDAKNHYRYLRFHNFSSCHFADGLAGGCLCASSIEHSRHVLCREIPFYSDFCFSFFALGFCCPFGLFAHASDRMRNYLLHRRRALMWNLMYANLPTFPFIHSSIDWCAVHLCRSPALCSSQIPFKFHFLANAFDCLPHAVIDKRKCVCMCVVHAFSRNFVTFATANELDVLYVRKSFSENLCEKCVVVKDA